MVRLVSAPKLVGLSLVEEKVTDLSAAWYSATVAAAGQGQHAGAALKLPVMPFWLVKLSVSPGEEAAAIVTVATPASRCRHRSAVSAESIAGGRRPARCS